MDIEHPPIRCPDLPMLDHLRMMAFSDVAELSVFRVSAALRADAVNACSIAQRVVSSTPS
jgi:hypothetical protein